MEKQILRQRRHAYRRFHNHVGFSFPTPVVVASSFFAFVGLLMVFVLPIPGVLTLVFFGYICTNTCGFEMDGENNRCREYIRLFGIKRGKWITLSEMQYVCVMVDAADAIVASMSDAHDSEFRYHVYILNESKDFRMLVLTFNHKERAILYAQRLADGVPLKLDVCTPEGIANLRRAI